MIEGIRPELVLAYMLARETYRRYSFHTCEIIGMNTEGNLLRLSDPGRATGDGITSNLGRDLEKLGDFTVIRTGGALEIHFTLPKLTTKDVEVDSTTDSPPS